MLKTLYGEIMTGRLKRLPYLGYNLLVMLLFVLIGFGISTSIGLAERMANGEIPDLQALIWDELGVIGVLLIGVALTALALAQINIAVKRIRDIGLPGWWLLLTIAVLGVFASIIGGSPLASGVNLLIFLSLLILPTDSFGKYEGEAPP
ncbi:DUF805 domain-containing protein [Thiorhodococcus mannitoliphagus]|uniref:DUF805 domain-containing protein n=1 Tax=Thiorhodococcus mannitoliphagus TaxID=329406 RepID=A0A6P1DTW2_9GAMM|nr:DUF805 domain-containing protein [Thiorhodococcus mannitoliphagus]NEX19134.1 DUF805 domain-containing protein [Thiorhodococcus mannitoliphagus]